MAVAVAALGVLAILKRQGQQAEPTAPSATPVTRETVLPAEVGTASSSAANAEAPNPPVGVEPAASERIPEPGERFTALIAELRPKVDAALRVSDYQTADRHVDEVLATPGLDPLEKQRLMVVKMASRGMRGDHAGMLALMDEIIAVAPDSALFAQLAKERPQIEKIQRLGPNHPELCDTCGQMHAPGKHPAAKDAKEPQD